MGIQKKHGKGRLDKWDSSDESSDDETTPQRPLLTDLKGKDTKAGGLSRRAAQFFDQDLFKDIGGIPEEELASEAEDEEEVSAALEQLVSIRPMAEEEKSEEEIP